MADTAIKTHDSAKEFSKPYYFASSDILYFEFFWITYSTGLLTKDKTSETTVQN